MTQSATPLAAIAGPRKIGRYEVHAIESGRFLLDGGAMFGIVPKTIWSKTNPSDEENRIEMRLRCLLLLERGPDGKPVRVILIDTGIGTKWAAKQMAQYGIDHSQWALDAELGKLGISPEDVTDVVATHLHFDHMGGATRRVSVGAKEELVPSFANAKIWLQRQNWEQALQPNEKDRASYLSENFELYRGSPKLELLDTAPGTRQEILPGVFVRTSQGHTPGMQLVEVADDRAALIYCADAIPTASHIRVPFVMGYDCFPLTMIEEKKKLLREAEERGMLLFFEHCPRSEAASVHHDGKNFAVKQAYKFSAGDTSSD